MRTSPQPRRANRSTRPIGDPFCGSGGVLKDAAGFATLALFIAAVVWLAATAGELVALWRLGGFQ